MIIGYSLRTFKWKYIREFSANFSWKKKKRKSRHPSAAEVYSEFSETLETNDPGAIAKKIAVDFSTATTSSGRTKLFSKFLALFLYHWRNNEPAITNVLWTSYTSTLRQKRTKPSDPVIKEIMQLLRTGLPAEPIHFQGILNLSIDSLLAPNMASLVQGVEFTEHNHMKALLQLRTVDEKMNRSARNQESANHPHDCALLSYALGQSHRKLGHYSEALAMLERGTSQIRSWKSDECKCGLECSRDILYSELYRGIGAVHRKKDNFISAKSSFAKGRRNLRKSPQVVQSDFLYSYAYFLYEYAYRVFQSKLQKTRWAKWQFIYQLKKAQRLFVRSMSLRPRWSAPAARLQIVNQLLGETTVDGYTHARQVAEAEDNTEANLTEVLCMFAVLVNNISLEARFQTSQNYTSKDLKRKLDRIFSTKVVSQGPRSCFAFDSRVIRSERNLTLDDDLAAFYDLLQVAEQWTFHKESDILVQQKLLLEQFHKSRKKPSKRNRT